MQLQKCYDRAPPLGPNLRMADQSLAVNAPFRQGPRRTCIFCDSFHYGQCEVEQFARAKDVSRRVSNQGTVVPGFGEKTVNNLCEKAIWPMRVNTTRGIEFLHGSPYLPAVFHNRHLIMCDSFVWNLANMFNVVEKGYGIMIGTQ